MDSSSIIWGGVGVVALGIATNALWELAVRPAFLRGQQLLANVLSLGSRAMKDAIYKRAAKTDTGALTLEMYMMANGFLFGIMLFAMVVGGALAFGLVTPQELRETAPKGIPIGLGLVLGGALGHSFVAWRSSLAYNIASSFHRRLKILESLLTPEELANVRVRFFTMKTEADYLAVKQRVINLMREKFAVEEDDCSRA